MAWAAAGWCWAWWPPFVGLWPRGSLYIFCVNRNANKLEIKHAIEHIYRVKVASVNSSVMPGKMKRVRYKAGKTPDWKKAVITLEPGQKINLT